MMKKSGQFHFHEVELPSTHLEDDVGTDIPADLTAVRRHVASLEYQRIALARTVHYALRNLGTGSYNQDDAQRMHTAAALDLDRLDRLLSRARAAQAVLENPAARQGLDDRKLSDA
ncbi:hypothetical protein [Arthrobacter sp. MDT1-65]